MKTSTIRKKKTLYKSSKSFQRGRSYLPVGKLETSKNINKNYKDTDKYVQTVKSIHKS